MAALRGASLEVEVHSHDYQASLPKSTWLSMMRSRFWSTFSHCSDEELEAVGWGGRRGGPTAVGARRERAELQALLPGSPVVNVRDGSAGPPNSTCCVQQQVYDS